MSERISNFYKRFPKVYWVVLSFELLERGAYYSMMPLLSLHFFYNVGLSQELCLLLTVFMYPFQYAMPIFTSALAEKVGYKRQMVFGFTVLTGAYIFLSFAYNSITAIFAVMLIGFGIGCYKPLISSTIAKCTEQKDRNVAYSIYYWIVNFAATFFALTWGLLMLFKVIPNSAFAWIFRVSAVYFLVNIGVALLIFNEVPRSGQVKTLKDVTSNIKIAFRDKKFVIMMLLIAGFWALYSTTLAPFYMIMYGYRYMPIWIPVILLGVVNPGTIILLGVPLAKFAEKIESIKLLIGGVFVYLIGLSLVTFCLEILPLVFLGMIIYSIGEFMVAPGYLAFVSKLAPKEKVSAYIGCNFLASFAGIFGGALIFGLVASVIGVDMARPHFFYGILMAFGLTIFILFMAYNKAWGQDIIGRARAIEAMETGVSAEELESKKLQKEPLLFRIFDKKATPFIAAALIPIILFGSYAMGTDVFYPPEKKGEKEEWVFDPNDYNTIAGFSDKITGTLQEGGKDTSVIPIQLEQGQYLQSITFKLTWRDEADPNAALENQPDEFSLSVSDEFIEYVESGRTMNSHGSEGSITIGFNFGHDTEDSLNGTGDWEVELTLESCGNSEGPLGIWIQTDNSNSYTLEITTEVYDPIEE